MLASLRYWSDPQCPSTDRIPNPAVTDYLAGRRIRILGNTMALAPLDAVSLTSAIVQFVEFTCKLISEGNKIYGSAEGALVEHAELGIIAQSVRNLVKRVEECRTWAVRSKKDDDLTPEECHLQHIAALCQK